MMILKTSRSNLSSNDQVSLDLPFAETKSLTARIGPTPTFTRASSGTFIGSDGLIQTAAVNAPRFDHDPVSLICRGLLFEDNRTNLLLNSAVLATQTRTVTAVAHTLSFYGTGTVVLSGAHSATVVGTGAYPSRSTLTFTPTAGSLTLTVTGTVESAQLEAGAFATSYIPTTTASAVRSADVCSITGSNFTSFCNQTEGALSLKWSLLAPSSTFMGGATLAASDRFNLSVGITKSTDNRISNSVRSSYGLSAIFNYTNNKYGSDNETIIAYKQNDSAASFNGSTPLTDTVGAFASDIYPLIQMHIGSDIGSRMFGWISEVKYYRKRIPNAKLQALTA